MRPIRRIGVAGSSAFLDFDAGWPELCSALMDAGFDPQVIAWDEDTGSYGPLDLVLVNYCWGYVTRRDDFLAWAERVAGETLLVNPLPVLRWNSEKTYLRDLAEAGVPIVRTVFVSPGQAWQVPAEDYVVKPAVGSGGWWAARYAASAVEAAARHVQVLHAAEQTVLVQPYQQGVDEAGETAMVFFGGKFSHAVHKSPILDPDAGVIDALWERQVVTATEPAKGHIDVAQAAMAAVTGRFGETPYARVDVVDGNEGTPVVMEVELVEPALFLPLAGGAGHRFVEALTRLIER